MLTWQYGYDDRGSFAVVASDVVGDVTFNLAIDAVIDREPY